MKAKMPIACVPLPQIAIASAPPAAEPASPIATVSQTGIGSGPGTARRARPPVMKPNTMIMSTEPSTRPKESTAHHAAVPQQAGFGRLREQSSRNLQTAPPSRRLESLGRRLRAGSGGDELPAQILDLVAQLRRVFEPQLFGRG